MFNCWKLVGHVSFTDFSNIKQIQTRRANTSKQGVSYVAWKGLNVRFLFIVKVLDVL
jgi:hypothetical protein